MEVVVAAAATEFLLQNLKELVTSNVDLIAGVKKNADELIKELQGLQDFLAQSREAYNDDEFLDKLAKDVRKLLYRAEDAIDLYIVAASKQKSRSTIWSRLHAFDHAIELRYISKKLESIKQKVRGINTTKVDFGSTVSVPIRSDYAAREPLQKFIKPPIDDDMVGRGDELKEVISLFDGGSRDLEIISIVGMLGLGKTTLAREVFKHLAVEHGFQYRAFVNVSAEFSVREVFLKIAQFFDDATVEMDITIEKLGGKICKHLKNEKFLIVLDDIWTVEAWEQLKEVFPDNHNGSRILITTRSMNVAMHAGKTYHLRFLGFEESRELLLQRAFGKHKFPPSLEQYVKPILDRCSGLPLSMVLVAGLIKNQTESVWKKVAGELHIYSVGSSRQNAGYLMDLSFKNLPYYLKPCFLYLGVFLEGYEIPSKTLFNLWVAEGFVLPVNGQSNLEDVAEDYLEELAARSLVIVEKRRFDGRIKTIRIHDALRELCNAQAKKEEMFQEIKKSENSSNIFEYDNRRLYINSNVSEFIKSKPSGIYVRSFLSFRQKHSVPHVDFPSVIPKAFKLVRVLDIRSMVLTRFPAELFYLFLLKYIAIYSELKVIPEKMSNLRYLQSLIFETTHCKTLDINVDIWKMAHLRHLETNASASLVQPKEGSSIKSKMQTLSEISPESCCTIAISERAPELKKLGVRGKLPSNLEDFLRNLSNLKSLENLKLLNVDKNGGVCNFPKENTFPPNLKRLTLQNTKFGWEFMSALANLKKLQVLKLKDNAFMGRSWKADNDGFPALKVLHIGSTDLEKWEASADHFPSLSQLYLKRCSRLEAIPSDLVKKITLQLVHIHCCKDSVNTSAVELQSKAREHGSYLKLSIYHRDK